MTLRYQQNRVQGKRLVKLWTLILCVTLSAALLSGCSTNPATGKSQFAAFMSPEQELKISAQEHVKIVKQYGLYDNKALQAYVSGIGTRVTQETERPDITYKFYILDSPIVNAFALPGGYIYVSRGLLALANSEAELAGVLGHEAGHVTARHSAERYSRGVVTSLGGTLLSAALGSSAASQAIGLGTNLYLSGYSRGQENEADALGLRYMTQGGYDPDALSGFLKSLGEDKELAQKMSGKREGAAYFSTHPPTPERVAKTTQGAQNYQIKNPISGRNVYFRQIDSMIFGDSPAQGFARGNSFYHPKLGFKFDAPSGYQIINQPSQVVLKSNTTQAVMIFDIKGDAGEDSPSRYITNKWITDKNLTPPERIMIGGMSAATTSYQGSVNNVPMTIQLIAIKWSKDRYARFQIGIPNGLNTAQLDAIKTASYSFKSLSTREKKNLKPSRVKIITASYGDTAASLSKRQIFTDYSEDKFRLLNGLIGGEGVYAGREYKIIVAE